MADEEKQEALPVVIGPKDLLVSKLPSGIEIGVGALSSTMQIQVAHEEHDNNTVNTILSGKHAIRSKDGQAWASGMPGFPEWWETLIPGERIAIGFLYNERNLLSQKQVADFLKAAKVVPAT